MLVVLSKNLRFLTRYTSSSTTTSYNYCSNLYNIINSSSINPPRSFSSLGQNPPNSSSSSSDGGDSTTTTNWTELNTTTKKKEHPSTTATTLNSEEAVETSSSSSSSLSSNKDTLHLEDIAQMIAQEHELSSAKSRRIVRGVFDWIIENVADHNKEIKISGFGKFSNVQAKAKQMRHPQTGELFVVPEKQRVKFTPFHSFKSAMNEEKHG